MEFENEVMPFGKGTVNELFGAERLLGGQQSDFLPPLGMDLIDRIGEHVDHLGVSLKASVVWQSTKQLFAHHEPVGETWLYKYPCGLTICEGGSWDTRTPILHPAVAAVDATQAGYDDAYLRAMQNVDILVNVQRDESRIAIRRMVERYSKLTYNPFRLLLRGAVLWAVTAAHEMRKPGMIPYVVEGVPAPIRIGDVGGYSGIAKRQFDTVNDAIYIRCENADELYMVEVLQAMCSDTFPLDVDMTVAQVWPALSSPYVIYTSAEPLRLGTGRIDAFQVETTLRRLADVFDCHDLLREAMQAVQFFMCRPVGAGVLAGATNVKWPLPRSDLRVGAIGPLLAGISAEGMRSTPFIFPRPTAFFYGSAVRACFITAGYYEALLKYDDVHPVAQESAARTAAAKYNLLAMGNASRHLMAKVVVGQVAEAGWDCLTKPLQWLHPRGGNNFVKSLFRAAAVPWWTNVVLHMKDCGSTFISTWARPARVVGMPSPGRWYTYQMLPGVTAHQMGAAARWLNASVRYCVDDYASARRWVRIEVGTVNRFIPNLQPVVRVGRDTLGVAAVRFTTDVYNGLTFLEQLGQSVVTVHKESAITESPAAVDMLDAFLGSPPAPMTEIVVADSGDDPARMSPAAIELDKPILPVKQPIKDDIDWDRVAEDLALGHIAGVSGSTLRSALEAKPRKMSQEASAADELSNIQLPSILKHMDANEKKAFLKAVTLAAGRLAPHASTSLVNENLAMQQGSALTALNALADLDRPLLNWADEVAIEEAATAMLAESVSESAEVPVARDDPGGTSMTEADFGPSTSGDVLRLSLEQAAVRDVPAVSRTATVGFAPPSDL